MELIEIALAFLMAGSLVSLACYKYPRAATLIGMMSSLFACISAGVSVFFAFKNPEPLTGAIPIRSFGNQMNIGLDPLSSFFLLILLVISFAVSIYAKEYLSKYYGKKNIGVFWFFFNLLIASLVTVLIARNGLLFLIAWELSALSSFFLVTFEDEKKSVRTAGLIYLIAANIGSAFLIPLFILLDQDGSLNFSQLGLLSFSPWIFLLAFFGFGIKAGFVPFHVWLPEAHPAAPSPISALMSGVMIKLGLYGLIRTMTFMGEPPLWCALLFISIGVISGLVGILCALAQSDLKRLLAYSSIENIGVMVLALGIGFLGVHLHIPSLIVLGIAGAIFHCMNHAIFKSLLFMGAGAVYHATGSRDINSLGGLLKTMPKTGVCFLIAVLAISAVPGFLGFLSEFVIYMAAFRGMIEGSFYCLSAIIGLAVIGALTVVCFTGVYGAVFLGQARPKAQGKISDAGFFMSLSLIFIALSCLAVSWLFPFIVPFLLPVISQISGVSLDVTTSTMQEEIQIPLLAIIIVSAFITCGIAFLYFVRQKLLKRNPAEKSITWDCGYALPTTRMQYSFSSYVQLLMENFKVFAKSGAGLFTSKQIFPKKEVGEEPKEADLFDQFFYLPIIKKMDALASRLRWLQQGRLNMYILYIFLTLLALFIFKLG